MPKPANQILEKKTKIILADDQPKVCSALRLLLEHDSTWQIVGEASDAQTMQTMAEKFRPDMILLDWELPGLHGEKSIKEIHTFCPSIKVIAFSSQLGAQEAALRANVDAFISKGDPPQTVLAILKSINELPDSFA